MSLLATALSAFLLYVLLVAARDFLSTGTVWLPKLFRKARPSAFVPWHVAATYLLGVLCLAAGAACSAYAATLNAKYKPTSAVLLIVGGALVFLYRLSLPFAGGVILLVGSLVVLTFARHRKALFGALVFVALALFAAGFAVF
ncbi:hypothetical protein FSC37_13380 [Piscinibacter aquaticus]|uniref:Uncharacterized protein n=1 Tax=Piscinibacter aquaticus TaxID=392597 RepID=A0A5C6U0L5_9BURK|nr:hypothetical protein FSC37_13380 [Piscinibacter aquaticus]